MMIKEDVISMSSSPFEDEASLAIRKQLSYSMDCFFKKFSSEFKIQNNSQ
jgi:hypothetical protein